MKSVFKIKEEYLSFKPKKIDITYDSDAVLACIKGSLFKLNENKLDILKTIKANSSSRLFDKIKNILFFRENDLSFYDKDNDILNEELDLTLIYSYYFNTMMGILNEDNKEEIYKLLNFTVLSYNSNLSYFEEKRDVLDYEDKFISYQAKENEGESVLNFLEFFKEEVKNISEEKEEAKVIVK